MRKIYSIGEFRAAALRKDAGLGDCIIRMPLVTAKELEPEESRRVRFTITDQSIDRMGDTIAIDGWDLEAFKRNPVVLFGHDNASLPVARAVSIWREGEALKSIAEFATAEMSQFADRVFRMVRGGFLNAVSVGFSPRKWAWAEDEGRRLGIDFIEQELFEYSIVTVPANANALVEGKSLIVPGTGQRCAGWGPYEAEIETEMSRA